MTPDSTNTPTSKLTSASIAGLALLTLATPARTQEQQSNDVYELDKYVTVANRFEMPLDRVGSSVEIITASQLEVTNQPFVLEAIRTTPGFNVRNNGGPGNTIGITTRGLNGNRPTVLIDGIEVSNPASGRMVNFGNIFGGNISKVEILKGPQSSLYGADAIAGVINISTLAPSSYHSSIELGGGSYGTLQGTLNTSGRSDTFNYSASVSHYETDGFSSQDPSYGHQWADDDSYENTNIAMKVGFSPSENVRLYLIGYYNESDSQHDPGTPSPWTTDFANYYSENDQFFAKAGALINVSDNWDSQLDLSYTDTKSLSNFSEFSPPSISDGTRIKLDWQNTLRVSESWNIVAGTEYETEEDSPSSTERDNKSIYAENVLGLTESFDWTLGLRHDDNEDYGNETTYRTTFSYQLSDLGARVHSSYGTSFQAPSFIQLSPSNGWGNPDVKAEYGSGWDLGIEKSFADQNLAVNMTVFGYDIDDKIDWDSNLKSESRPYGTYTNKNSYKSKGIESAVSWFATDNLRFSFAHTYTSAEYENGTEAERVPRNTYSVKTNWSSLDSKLNLNATALYTGSQYSLKTDSTKMPSYTVVNLAARYKLSESYTLWARIDNLFDEEYEEIKDYQTAGFSVYGGFRYDF